MGAYAIYKIRRDLKKDKRATTLASMDRMISQGLYTELKKIRICGKCQSKLTKPGQIHHIVHKIDGGQNNRENLIVLCKQCHKKEHEKDGY